MTSQRQHEARCTHTGAMPACLPAKYCAHDEAYELMLQQSAIRALVNKANVFDVCKQRVECR